MVVILSPGNIEDPYFHEAISAQFEGVVGSQIVDERYKNLNRNERFIIRKLPKMWKWSRILRKVL